MITFGPRAGYDGYAEGIYLSWRTDLDLLRWAQVDQHLHQLLQATLHRAHRQSRARFRRRAGLNRRSRNVAVYRALRRDLRKRGTR